MIYPINIKPAPCIVSGEHKGTEITHVGVSPQNLDIYTKTEVVKGEPSMLPLALRRVLGHVLKEAGRPGPFIITPDEQAEDVTYDPDSSAPPKDKPEPSEVELTHPKERKLKQELGLMPPETETPLEMPKYEKFPPSLPSEHPKEKALERQLEQGAVTARGEDKLGFDINEINKALDLLQKSWQPPDSKDLGYQFNPIHSTIYPGKLIKSVAPKIAKPTDFSRAMQAVTTHWLKKNPPTLRTPSGEDYEDDDGTLNEIMDEVEHWWGKNKAKAISYYKTYKIPPQVTKIIDKVVSDAVAFNKQKGVDEKQYISQVAKHWAVDTAKYSQLKDLVGNLMGALVKTTNTIKPARGASVRQAVPIHTGPLTKKFMGEITHMLKKDEGAFAQTALNTPKYLATLTFTRKPDAQKVAKVAAGKGFPNAQVVVIYITLPQGQKKKRYAISNTDTERLKWGGVLLTKDGFKKLLAVKAKK
jgi:hypothetical protein